MRRTYLKLKTLLPALAVALLLVCSLPAALGAEGEESAPPARSGTCGDGLTWSLSAGTLTIEGEGAMTNFTEQEMAPWYGLREEILRLSLPDGLTSVGNLAFYGCEGLGTVALPDSVEQVGAFSFMDCTGLALLDLGSGVESVGSSAFLNCYDLRSVELPDSVEQIGMKAFYRCESIPSVIVPEGVTELGISAFGYCKNLVAADVRADITELSEFLFYGCEKLSTVSLPAQITQVNEFSFRGCDQLNTVSYGGESTTLERLNEVIGREVATDEAPAATSTGGSAAWNEDGSITQTNVTVAQGEKATVAATVERDITPEMTLTAPTASVQVAVSGDEGWQEASQLLTDSLAELKELFADSGAPFRADVAVDVKGTDTVDPGFVDTLAGENVQMNITTRGGSTWKVDCSQLEQESLSGEYDLSCTLSAAPQEICAQVGSESVFLLRFHSSAQVNAEVVIALGGGYARRSATLFKMDDGELTRYQTVVVDGSGRVHFYLASVTNEADYYIAMDLAAENDDAIIPDELLAEYGAETLRYQPIEYEITGRTSSWGMTINQVTWIMVGVLVVVVVAVGVTMFLLNKRKLKMGYVPDLDDED